MREAVALRQAAALLYRNSIDASGGGALHVGSTPEPAQVESAPSSAPVAILALAEPCAAVVVSGQDVYLEFAATTGNAAATGSADWVRFVDGAGTPVLQLTAGLATDLPTPEVVLDARNYFAGGEVQLVSARIYF